MQELVQFNCPLVDFLHTTATCNLQARLLPITEANRNQQRVLVPGSGLGRLVYDLARAGWAAQVWLVHTPASINPAFR
jgi:hypothetical protein